MGNDGASGPEDAPWRLFLAADVPREVRSRLADRLKPLRDAHPELRWSPEENWHVTMKFLGAVWPQLLADVKAGVASVAAGADRFDTRLTGADAFPNARRARVLWIGMSDPEERFPALVATLDVALGGIVTPEERPFTPHLTVARAKRPVAIGEELTSLADLESDPFPVDRVVLYRSHLRRTAPIYEPLEAFPLR